MNAKRNVLSQIALAAVCVGLVGLLTGAPAEAGTTGTTYYTCTVDITAGTNNCTDNVITATLTSGIYRVLRANLGTSYQRLDVFANVSNPTNWWIHLADSPTTNGFGGDAELAVQSLEVRRSALRVGGSVPTIRDAWARRVPRLCPPYEVKTEIGGPTWI